MSSNCFVSDSIQNTMCERNVFSMPRTGSNFTPKIKITERKEEKFIVPGRITVIGVATGGRKNHVLLFPPFHITHILR